MINFIRKVKAAIVSAFNYVVGLFTKSTEEKTVDYSTLAGIATGEYYFTGDKANQTVFLISIYNQFLNLDVVEMENTWAQIITDVNLTGSELKDQLYSANVHPRRALKAWCALYSLTDGFSVSSDLNVRAILNKVTPAQLVEFIKRLDVTVNGVERWRGSK
jgi:hypothetical protein